MKNCRRNNILSTLFLDIRTIGRSVIGKLGILAVFLSISPIAFSSVPYCNSIFFNGLITQGVDSHIQFERNAQLLGSEYTFLSSSKVTSDYSSSKESCGDFFCKSTGGSTSEPIIVPRQEIFSNNDIFVNANKKKVISNATGDYGKISIGRHASISFPHRESGYSINELNLEHKSQLQLSAGDYWISSLNLAEHGKIEIIGEGTVTLYVINDLMIPEKFKINDNSKDAAKLIIYSFGNLNVATNSKTHAFIHALGDVKLEKKSQVTGSVIARNIHLGESSKVIFAEQSLANLKFGDFCSGAPPTRDFTAPVIELDPFPYNTLATSVTVSGKITEPDNGMRWMQGAWLYSYGNIISIPLDSDGRFSIELPLSSTKNDFKLTAQDKSYNSSDINFTVWRESEIEFAIKMDSYEWQQFKPELVSGVISTPEGTYIETAFIKTAQGDIPLELVNNRFSLYLPFVRGYNEYLVVARDQDGNEISETIYIDGLSIAVFKQVHFSGAYDTPERKITGLIFSLWPIENLLLTIDEIPQTLTQVGDGIYEFETQATLSVGRNRLRFLVTTPEGQTYEEYDDWYEPDRVFLTVYELWGSVEVTSETITIAGDLHIPAELIRENMSLVVVSDRHPDIEYQVNTPTLNETGWSEFSIEIPLEPGVNNLLVKVKQGEEDVQSDVGVYDWAFTAIRN